MHQVASHPLGLPHFSTAPPHRTRYHMREAVNLINNSPTVCPCHAGRPAQTDGGEAWTCFILVCYPTASRRPAATPPSANGARARARCVTPSARGMERKRRRSRCGRGEGHITYLNLIILIVCAVCLCYGSYAICAAVWIYIWVADKSLRERAEFVLAAFYEWTTRHSATAGKWLRECHNLAFAGTFCVGGTMCVCCTTKSAKRSNILVYIVAIMVWILNEANIWHGNVKIDN